MVSKLKSSITSSVLDNCTSTKTLNEANCGLYCDTIDINPLCSLDITYNDDNLNCTCCTDCSNLIPSNSSNSTSNRVIKNRSKRAKLQKSNLISKLTTNSSSGNCTSSQTTTAASELVCTLICNLIDFNPFCSLTVTYDNGTCTCCEDCSALTTTTSAPSNSSNSTSSLKLRSKSKKSKKSKLRSIESISSSVLNNCTGTKTLNEGNCEIYCNAIDINPLCSLSVEFDDTNLNCSCCVDCSNLLPSNSSNSSSSHVSSKHNNKHKNKNKKNKMSKKSKNNKDNKNKKNKNEHKIEIIHAADSNSTSNSTSVCGTCVSEGTQDYYFQCAQRCEVLHLTIPACIDYNTTTNECTCC